MNRVYDASGKVMLSTSISKMPSIANSELVCAFTFETVRKSCVISSCRQILRPHRNNYTVRNCLCVKSKHTKRRSASITYALNQKITLETFLKNPRTVLTNNLAEQSVNPPVIGRKNWLFSICLLKHRSR